MDVTVGAPKNFRSEPDPFLKKSFEIGSADVSEKLFQFGVGFVVFQVQQIQGDGKSQLNKLMPKI